MKLTREILESMIYDIMEAGTKVELGNQSRSTYVGGRIGDRVGDTVIEPGHQPANYPPSKPMDMKKEEKDWLEFIKMNFKEHSTKARLLYIIESLLYIEKHLGKAAKLKHNNSLQENLEGVVGIRARVLTRALSDILKEDHGIDSAVENKDGIAIHIMNSSLTSILTFYENFNIAYNITPAVRYADLPKNVSSEYSDEQAKEYADGAKKMASVLLASLERAIEDYKPTKGKDE
ncbi:hypothetical protein OAT10_00370 [Luminiphilus sp.]|nr:hypothetical protein [Luminiphilus sp.]